jgi:exoribonuclease R
MTGPATAPRVGGRTGQPPQRFSRPSHSITQAILLSDLITQYLLNDLIKGQIAPYNKDGMGVIVYHLTAPEHAANKVEQRVDKSDTALLLESKIDQQFDALVTRVVDKGTWARLLDILIDGKSVQEFMCLDEGDRVSMKLMSIDVECGFIDIKKVGSARQ